MKMNLFSILVLSFAAVLFCQNALAVCKEDIVWKALMEAGKYDYALFHANKNLEVFAKTYSPFCAVYFATEPTYKLGKVKEAVSFMKAAIESRPDSYKENGAEWHKAVHWTIELAEQQIAGNQLNEARSNLDWALDKSPKTPVCSGYPIENKSPVHAYRLIELYGDIEMKRGQFGTARWWYANSKMTADIIKKISTAEEKMAAAVSSEMVKIPAGSFKMGSSPEGLKRGHDNFEGKKSLIPNEKLILSREQKQHTVTISKDFYIGKYEVTQAQWKAIMGSLPNQLLQDNNLGDDRPMVWVNWDDTQKFIERVNSLGRGKYRLPTEAEWEYAARGGTSTTYYWGKNENDACRYANIGDAGADNSSSLTSYLKCKDGYAETAPVGKFLPNSYGLYDMSGNVAEWCQDFFGNYKSENQTDPTGPASPSLKIARIVRGGSWNHGDHFSSGYHDWFDSNTHHFDIGFRLVREN